MYNRCWWGVSTGGVRWQMIKPSVITSYNETSVFRYTLAQLFLFFKTIHILFLPLFPVTNSLYTNKRMKSIGKLNDLICTYILRFLIFLGDKWHKHDCCSLYIILFLYVYIFIDIYLDNFITYSGHPFV